jgi:glycosyltransferase involved in cell wall biosynthesis
MKIAFLTTDGREHFRRYEEHTPWFGTAPAALLEGFKMMPKEIEVHVISCLQRTPISSPIKLAENIYYHGLYVPNIGWMKTGYLGCVRAVRRKLREIRPNIVHGQGTERDCAICAVFSGFPNVVTIHGNMRLIAGFLGAKPLTYYWLASRLEAWCLQRTAGVIAISAYTESAVTGRTPRTWLVPNAVHPSFFVVPRRAESPPRVLCVGNIDRRKNQVGLIAALDRIQREQRLEVRFAGRGTSEDGYFRGFMDALADSPWCHHLGPLGREALQAELATATALVLPSFEDNCPMVILEAAAAGVPVAAARVGGIPELVLDGETGVLFDPHSAPDMARVIGNLLADEAMRHKLAARAREVSLARFAPQKVAEQHLQIYRDVVAEAQSRHRPS